MSSETQTPRPREVRVSKDRTTLTLVHADGRDLALPAELLRVLSPSAEVRGHGAEMPPPVAGKRHVRIANVAAVGNYAIRIAFDDGHDTGIYSWALLNALGADRDAQMMAYEARLAEYGMSRG